MEHKKLIPQKQSIKPQIISWLLVAVFGIVQAFGLYIFVLPNNFSPGGITGIASVFYYLNPKLNTGYFIIAFNVPLLIAAWFILKKDFVIKTAVSILLTSVLLIIIPLIDPDGALKYVTQQTFLAAVAGGVIGGVVLGGLFRLGGSNGGSEIIGRFIQRKFPQYNVSWFIFGLDSIVVLSTAFIIKGANPVDIILLSIIKMFVGSMVSSTIMQGLNSAIKFEIITGHPEELAHEILEELSRGVTILHGHGAYSGASKSVLLCVVRKRQIGPFQKLLKKYPDTFAYIMNTREVYGRGFSVPVNTLPSKNDSAKSPETQENSSESGEQIKND